MNNPAGCPRFSCGNRELEQAFALALETLASNTKQGADGPCLMAGADYPTEWTRDAAINVWFAEALLDPETARNTLLGVLEEKEDGPEVGGQYWDRIIWAIGAERLWDVTGDEEFARLAYGVLRRTAERCIREEYDPEDGLFRGPAVYGDGVSAYPPKYRNPSMSPSILRWPEEHPEERVPVGGGIPMKALSTNCIYEHAFCVIARLAEVNGEDGSEWTRRADGLKEAIRSAFRNQDTGLFDYLAKECDAQESLGLAFAILFGIADGEQTRSILEHTYRTKQGIPCVWPAFPPYNEQGYGRHSGTVWPHIQGFWALAALKAGRGDLFEEELYALASHAVRDGQFAEIYHPEDGRIYGGIQEGFGKYIEWRSCEKQTWSAAAFLAMVFYGIFGLNPDGTPGQPYVPEGIAYARLDADFAERIIQIEGKTEEPIRKFNGRHSTLWSLLPFT